jgi:transposase
MPKSTLRFFMTAGQLSDHQFAADPAYNARWFQKALTDKGIKPCIHSRKLRGKPFKHSTRRDKRRNRIAIMFGMLKDYRRIATRYRKLPKVFLSAVTLAATVMLWL